MGQSRFHFNSNTFHILTVCCDDLWFLEVEPPSQSPPIITLSRANTNSLEVQWPADPNADKYLLQIQRVDPQAEAEQSLFDKQKF